MNQTIDYYNQNAEDFVQGTVAVDFHEIQQKFLALLKPGAHILDFGCGSGRDTKYFLDQGCIVDATDGSLELCVLASQYTGIEVRQMYFQELSAKDEYDGIWACASILHLSKADLKPVLIKIVDALKTDGILYTSFKYGEYEGERNGRYFTDFTEEAFREFVRDIKELSIIELWITEDVRPERNEKWLNLLMQKN